MGNVDDHSTKVKLISECFIKPNYKNKESKKPHYLLGVDLVFMTMPYIERGFLFSKPSTSFKIESLLEKLKHSLSQALAYYYPLAGQFATIKYEDEHASSIYVDCNKGSGAKFMYATALDTATSDVISCNSEMSLIVRHFFDMGEDGIVNYDGHNRPLVTLQVTELSDGVFLGFTMNHSVADGTCFWKFMRTLSEVFRTIDNDAGDEKTPSISCVPIFKPVIPEGCSLIQKLPYLDPNEFITRVYADPQQRLRVRIFHFSASSIAKLKGKAISESCEDGIQKISSFQAVAALIWISIDKAQNVQPEEMTYCYLPLNIRPRLSPPLPSDQFGNIVQTLTVTSKVGELLNNGLGCTAMLLHKKIAAANNQDTVLGSLKAIMEKPVVVSPDAKSSIKNRLMLTGSAKFIMYGPEFGLGKAIAVTSGGSNKVDGKVKVMPGREGVGSVDLEVCLFTHNMIRLESDEHFMSFAF